RSAGVGKGATFAVELPLTPLHASDEETWDAGQRHPTSLEPNSAARESVRLDAVRVLVVDDDSDAAGLIRRLLEECGASVSISHSVDDALNKLDSEKPDLLLSDIGMPGKDGYDMIQAVRERDAKSGGQTPAIALTAFARSEDRMRALQ